MEADSRENDCAQSQWSLGIGAWQGGLQGETDSWTEL